MPQVTASLNQTLEYTLAGAFIPNNPDNADQPHFFLIEDPDTAKEVEIIEVPGTGSGATEQLVFRGIVNGEYVVTVGSPPVGADNVVIIGTQVS